MFSPVGAVLKSGLCLGEKNDFLGDADDFLPKAETGVGRGFWLEAGKLRFVTGKQQLEARKNCFLTVFFLNDAEQATMSFSSSEKESSEYKKTRGLAQWTALSLRYDNSLVSYSSVSDGLAGTSVAVETSVSAFVSAFPSAETFFTKPWKLNVLNSSVRA